MKKERPPSPLSPTKVSRIEEKQSLTLQNNRLAAYIDRVRALELDKGSLEKQVRTIEETNTREVTTLKSSYDNELRFARQALDETAKEKAKMEMGYNTASTENKELRDQVKEKDAELTRLARTNKMLEAQNKDLRNAADDADTELRSARPELATLRKRLEDGKKNLEDETLKRIDLQNQLQTMKEEHKFNEQVLTQQLNESKTRKMMEIEEVDSRVSADYEAQLTAQLAALRENHEDQIKQLRGEFQNNLEKRVKDLQDKLAYERNSAATAIQELKEVTTRTAGQSDQLVYLERMKTSLEENVKNLQKQLEAVKMQHRADMAVKDREIDDLNQQLVDLTKEYEELSEIKVKLGFEIDAYRKLLDGEETRLGLSPEGPSRKRKRVESEEYTGAKVNTSYTQPGAILVEPMDDLKNNVKVTNTIDVEVNLGGMVLKMMSDGFESSYKFTRAHKLAAGATFSVYSADSGVLHSVADGTLVMKSGAWKVGDDAEITLVNKDGEEVATRNMSWEYEAKGISSSFYGDVSSSQSVLAARKAEGEKCVIM